MPDFEDYSSALITNTTNVEEILKNFSKDALARIAQMGSTEILRMDAGYFTYATAMFGQPLALELDAEIWRRAAWTVIRRAKQFFNIEGSDVATLFKCYQVDPGTIGTMVDVEYQLKDNNHGILTVKKCLSLGYFERHVVGAYHRKYACDTIHREAFENTARHINPYITVKCLKPPPRQSKDDIACRWEFKQEQ